MRIRLTGKTEHCLVNQIRTRTGHNQVYVDPGSREGVATREECRTAVLDSIYAGRWQWYTERGIMDNLKGVKDGNGGPVFGAPGPTLPGVLDELERDGKLKVRKRDGTEEKEYSLAYVDS